MHSKILREWCGARQVHGPASGNCFVGWTAGGGWQAKPLPSLAYSSHLIYMVYVERKQLCI